MAYDESIAQRIRSHLAAEPGVTEKKMFGGLAFLVNGNMGVAAAGQGGMMVRIDPGRADELVDDVVASRMVMKGRPMNGWLLVQVDGLDDEAFDRWVALGSDHARSLPAK